MNTMKTLPHDWLADCEMWLDGSADGAMFEIPQEVDGQPNKPVYTNGVFRDGDWIVAVKCIKSSDYLREHNINDGDIIGFAVNYKVFC